MKKLSYSIPLGALNVADAAFNETYFEVPFFIEKKHIIIGYERDKQKLECLFTENRSPAEKKEVIFFVKKNRKKIIQDIEAILKQFRGEA